MAPPQAIAIDEDYATQHPPIIDPRLAMALRKEGLKPLHLLVRQPEKVVYHHPRQFGGVNQEATPASSQSMGPDPSTAAVSQHELIVKILMAPDQ